MNPSETHMPSTMLICSVGGTPEPVATAIYHTRPARVLLWHSEDTCRIDRQALANAGFDENNADFAIVPDPQDFHKCVASAHALQDEVRKWQKRPVNPRVIVDFTGGTKAMSAALALVAHRWDCTFLYIAGNRRTRDGTGTVVTGCESPIQQANPYDALAYQPLQDAVQLFNHGQPAAAAAILEPYTGRPDLDQSVKRRILAVQHLASAYAQWDAFQHKKAVAAFNDTLKFENDLDAALPNHGLTTTLTDHRDLCRQLHDAHGKPSRNLILDLLANADRRADDGRFDDATARLYRATEALAQLALLQDHQIDAAACPIDKLPEPLRQKWDSRTTNGPLKLALQDAYYLLAQLDHNLGRTFRDLKLHEKTSPLTARNQSILAHGFAPTTRKDFNALHDPIHRLAGSPDLQAFTFPTLPEP